MRLTDRYHDRLTGVLSCFERIVITGALPGACFAEGMTKILKARGIRVLAELLRAKGDLIVGENEPYRVSDLTDYTVPAHGERRGLPHVEIEIRQDLIADAAGQRAWAERLAGLLPAAYAGLLHR